MKRLVKYLAVGQIITVIVVFLLLTSGNKIPAPKIHTYICKDMKVVEAQIKSWSEYGYKVQFIACQSVSTNVKYRNEWTYETTYRTDKGDILLVMIKD